MSKRKDDGLDFEITKEPELKRRFKLWWFQWLGLPILLAIPVLGLTGVLGDKTESFQTSAHHEQIEISGEYPTKLHYGKAEQFSLVVHNKSDRVVNELTLKFDETYMSNFDDVQFLPSIDETYKVKIKDLKPGQSSHITVSVRGEKYGRHNGKVEAIIGNRTIASVDLKSTVFP